MMKDQDYFNAVAGVVAVAVVVIAGILLVAFPNGTGPATATSASGPTSYVNLSISINATTGWPQYSPANFTVPQGRVVFTITDHDAMMSWTGCPCAVKGTVNGVETFNGTSYSTAPNSNVAHTFSIPALGLNVLSPGQSVVMFTLDVTNTVRNRSWGVHGRPDEHSRVHERHDDRRLVMR
jgi:hypothetical protein